MCRSRRVVDRVDVTTPSGHEQSAAGQTRIDAQGGGVERELMLGTFPSPGVADWFASLLAARGKAHAPEVLGITDSYFRV